MGSKVSSKSLIILTVILVIAIAVGIVVQKKNSQKSNSDIPTKDGYSESETSNTEETEAMSEETITVSSATEANITEPSSASEKETETQKQEKTTSTAKSTTNKTKPSTSSTQKVQKVTYIKGILVVNKTYGLPESYAPGVNSEAKKAFDTLSADAAKEGLDLHIRSGYRSYDYQKNLYNNYVAKDGKAEADRYSARPGHSEHQTGLAFDINSLSQSFENTAEGKWLAKNCWKYGFIIRYPKGKESITGYMYEPWHIRYIGQENAKAVYNSGLTLEEYLGINSKYVN